MMLSIAQISLIICTCICVRASPPLYEITATSMYGAGLQHGRMASSRIKGWLSSEEMSSLVAFVQGAGKEKFRKLKEVNSAHYPELVDQMQGIAHGADISLDSVWILNLITELEAVESRRNKDGHCSDIYTVSDGNFNHGHNEDWEGVISKYWYFAKYIAAPSANFESCAGLVYPGSVIGWAPTWNSHGMYLTQNSLFPLVNSDDGVSTVFAQASAICGKSGGKGQDAIVAELIRNQWSSGASVNLIDIKRKTMANVEVHRNKHSIYQVTNGTTTATNYSHFNMYKHLAPGTIQNPEASTVHRQARVDALPPPRTRADIIERLSDATDRAYPIYREMTLATLILDGSIGRMDVWCCGHSSASGGEPIYSWDMLNFFGDTEDSNVLVL